MVFEFFGNFSMKATIDLCTLGVGSVKREETSHSCMIWNWLNWEPIDESLSNPKPPICV